VLSRCGLTLSSLDHAHAHGMGLNAGPAFPLFTGLAIPPHGHARHHGLTNIAWRNTKLLSS